MIHTLADLINRLRERELQALARYEDIGHSGMIGDMYEGLTHALVERTLFNGLDLRVVTGKVRWSDGNLSRQIDVMLVVGDGERVPYTEHFIYPLRKVLAVIEVKKTLYGDALADAYENLLSVSGNVNSEPLPTRRIEHAFRVITQRELPADGDLTRLSRELRAIAYMVARDAILPVRIVLGYDGYVSEATLREGFVHYLNSVISDNPRQGYGPSSFPNLIICGGNCLVKLNGMPFAINHNGPAGEWLLYGSLPHRWSHLLLEVLWTRIASVFGLPSSIFGEDLDIEQHRPLLWVRRYGSNDDSGWVYEEHTISGSALAAPSTAAWEPVIVSEEELAVLKLLGERGSINTANDTDYLALVNQTNASAFIERLRIEGIAIVDEIGVLRFLTNKCEVMRLPDGRLVAGENSTGRLTRWISQRPQGSHRDGDA